MITSKIIDGVIIIQNDTPQDVCGPSIYMTSGHTQYVALHDWTVDSLKALRMVVDERIAQIELKKSVKNDQNIAG